MSNYPPVQINFRVEGAMYRGLTKFANAQGQSVSGYAKLLFEAAYTARCGETGDKALDKAVAKTKSAPPASVATADTVVVKVDEDAVRAALAPHLAEIAELRAKAASDKDDNDVLRAKMQALSDQIAASASDRKLLAAANTEVANLSAELKIFQDKAEADEREISTLTTGLMSATRENEILRQRLAEKAEAPAKIVLPVTELGAFLASWSEDAA